MNRRSTLELLEGAKQNNEDSNEEKADQSLESRKVTDLIMLPATRIKERDKRENTYGDKKKSMAINSDLGEIFEAK